MTTIRHTTTLFEYDGPQLFVARDDDGGQYLALLMDSEERQDRYLVVQVDPEPLSQFRAGALELRPLIAEASRNQWYLATTTNLDEPLAIELQRTPIEERFLPDEGFTLADSPLDEGVLETDIERNSGPPANSVEVRERLIEALKLDLVGPWAGHALAEERLPGWVRPSNWYLTGFLIPSDTPIYQRDDDDDDDDFGGEVSEEAGLPEESSEERKAAKKGYFPSSMGLSFLASKEAEKLHVTVRWGDYAAASIEGSDGKSTPVWQRTPCTAAVEVPLAGDDPMSEHDVPDSDGLRLHVVKRQVGTEQIPSGTQAVSVFLVNRRNPAEDKDSRYAFQAEIEVQSEHPFVPRPDPRGAQADEWDDKVADLHYADVPEYATGHGVSAEWDILDNHCQVVRTAWIPSAEVEKTETAEISDVELSMEALGALDGGDSAQAALSPLVVQYRRWIDQQQQKIAGLAGERREIAEQLIQSATAAAERIQRGIDALAAEEDALDAFRVANRAVARALRQRLKIDEPQWHPFQLAFIMINLPGLVDPQGSDRKIVDLLFFPTGGGKTEAYLGLAAFAMVLRRLRHRGGGAKAGAGVSVIMRYTLRLLTLDQLSRAAGLVCALELEREEDRGRYGEWPFEIGLWVGKAATPNFLGRKGDGRSDSARSKVTQFKTDPKNKPSPIPLENCPWCGTRFEPDSFSLEPDANKPRNLLIVCTNFECDFSGNQALPIVAVDEPLYRRLPAFLIATVDKFASLPWVGPSGVLLGGADRHDDEGFYGAAEPRKGTPLEVPLSPPDLIVQDELHLISGPLGTMVGLYESAIEALCVRSFNGRAIRPKIVASTATVRRAQDQIHALFGRSLTQVFPPPGPDRRDSFFARIVPADDKPARRYLGIASPGRNPKVLMRRVLLALMGAAQRAWQDAGGSKKQKNPADPYMTVLAYFNSLKELGGARRIIEEEVQNTLKGYGARRRVGEERGLFRDRQRFSEVVELTSRVPTDKVAEARRRLDLQFHENQRVDCAIATNMISVGLDIQRLGLMVVLGQPKAHAEYIQATSRVGRDDARPGLVLTLLNVHKPRDRSHYERFRHYHETFYRSVEVGSVTPFAARALDRGFSGVLVALSRHVEVALTPAEGAARIAEVRAALERRLLDAFRERVREQPLDEAEREERLRSVQNRVGDLLDSWCKIFDDYSTTGVELQYQKYELEKPRPLLRDMLDTEFESEYHRKFRANRSLRDVEPEVNLFLGNLTP